MAPLKDLYDSAIIQPNSRRNRIQEWAAHAKLSKRDKAALNHRFHMLEQMDYDLAIGTKVLNGPLRGSGGIYKLKAFGDRAFRPMLCRGTVDPVREYTILEGAIEVEMGKLRPPDAESRARKTRDEVAAHPLDRRLPHEPF